MDSGTSANRILIPVFFIVTASLVMFVPQSIFAGVQGGESDPDGDNWFSDDNCPYVYNPGQEDINDDGIGDACIPLSQLVDEVIDVVEDTLEDITDLSDGQINSIINKLESAADKLDNGKINGAIGSLNAFINQIESLINSGQLDEDQGQEFINAVESIIEAIE